MNSATQTGIPLDQAIPQAIQTADNFLDMDGNDGLAKPHKVGDPKRKNSVLHQLNEVDYKIPILGESAIESIKQIEKIFANTTVY